MPLAFNLILLIQLSGHAGLLNVGSNLPTSTIYFSLSVGLNVILTLLIVGRILYHARMTTINQSKLPERYTSVSAMLIESAALSAVTGIVLIVTLHTNVASSIGAESLYGVMTVCEYQFHCTNLILMQALSPTLIAYRVSSGNAWTRNTTQETTVRPYVASSAVVSRTVLTSSSEDRMKCGTDSIESKPGNIYRKDQVPMEV